MRILLIEDERELAASLRNGLVAEGYAVDIAHDGRHGLSLAGTHPYDAVILDIMLPGLNGYRVCAQLRRDGVTTPVLMLTAKDGEYDEAEALDTGADDYLAKPFSYLVLLARLRALLRRGGPVRPGVVRVGDLSVDIGARRCRRGADEVV
jgi:DNA-binding response OmpR family regulator